MAILPIVLDPADVLRKKAKPVTKVNASIRQLLDDMAETMYEAPGVGLAAPQVGVSKRVLVLDPQDEKEDDPESGTGLVQIVNPEIVFAEGWVKGTEGCLSIPGYVGDVWRYEHVKVTGLDRMGHKVYYDVFGWLARIFQHEIDHLDGVLYTDKCINLRDVTPGTEEEEEAKAMAESEGSGELLAETASVDEETPKLK
ncbi:MAG TPA: peptide deformylase [Symbiobacteriaceae bacterium]|jgi:peptide deformylase